MNRNGSLSQKATDPSSIEQKKKGHGKCLEGETRGEKRVKRPKRPNTLICRTPGGSIRYLLSCSLGMTLISHSIVSIPALHLGLPSEQEAAALSSWRGASRFFFALCCLGKIPGGAPFSQLHKGGNGSRVDRP